jgi:hypothetical protein
MVILNRSSQGPNGFATGLMPASLVVEQRLLTPDHFGGNTELSETVSFHPSVAHLTLCGCFDGR